uniref:CREB-regulated transcription coactivator 1 n=1 Tax=Cacopsylla melanoneura TaxID=428564 RepID=A0A8D8YV03_9HEMI
MGDGNASPNHHIDYTQLGSLNNTYQPVHIKTEDCNTELTGDPGYFSTSPSQQMRTASSNTTPNTPSSIPDIILTAPDFSESEDLVAKSTQLGYSNAFESDFFPSDESLREGLDPIDLDGLQMLTDPELITDPATEDHFRLDRL